MLVLGLDALGNPYGLITEFGKGFKDLFYEPYLVRFSTNVPSFVRLFLYIILLRIQDCINQKKTKKKQNSHPTMSQPNSKYELRGRVLEFLQAPDAIYSSSILEMTHKIYTRN